MKHRLSVFVGGKQHKPLRKVLKAYRPTSAPSGRVHQECTSAKIQTPPPSNLGGEPMADSETAEASQGKGALSQSSCPGHTQSPALLGSLYSEG